MDFLMPKDKKFSKNHHSYITPCNFILYGKDTKIRFLIDTGAEKTVITLEDLTPVIRNKIRELPYEDKELRGIIGAPFKYRKVQLVNFQIAEGLVIPKIAVGVTEEPIARSLLGFDVLSLFTLRYDASINNGLWHIASDKDAKSTIEDIMKRSLNNSFDYIDPDFIAPITEVPFSPEDYLRERLGSKINYIAPISRQECKTEEDCLALIRQVNNVLGQ